MAGAAQHPSQQAGWEACWNGEGGMDDSIVPNEIPPERPTSEADPAYDYAEDLTVEADWDEEDDVLDEEERVVPLDDEAHREPGEPEE